MRWNNVSEAKDQRDRTEYANLAATPYVYVVGHVCAAAHRWLSFCNSLLVFIDNTKPLHNEFIHTSEVVWCR